MCADKTEVARKVIKSAVCQRELGTFPEHRAEEEGTQIAHSQRRPNRLRFNGRKFERLLPANVWWQHASSHCRSALLSLGGGGSALGAGAG